jgi:hypothetical protein
MDEFKVLRIHILIINNFIKEEANLIPSMKTEEAYFLIHYELTKSVLISSYFLFKFSSLHCNKNLLLFSLFWLSFKEFDDRVMCK